MNTVKPTNTGSESSTTAMYQGFRQPEVIRALADKIRQKAAKLDVL